VRYGWIALLGVVGTALVIPRTPHAQKPKPRGSRRRRLISPTNSSIATSRRHGRISSGSRTLRAWRPGAASFRRSQGFTDVDSINVRREAKRTPLLYRAAIGAFMRAAQEMQESGSFSFADHAAAPHELTRTMR
jgi:hypothetical protein